MTCNNKQLCDAWQDRQPGEFWADVAKKFNMTRDQFRGRVRRYAKKNGINLNPQQPQDEPQVTVTEETNRRVIEVKAAGPSSLDELIELSKSDLEVWHIPSHKIGTWTTSAYDRNVSEWIPIINSTVRAEFMRKEPVAIIPTIQPVTVQLPHVTPTPIVRESVHSVLAFGDPHFGFRYDFQAKELVPFHDQKALDLVCVIARLLQPKTIIILGDLLDNAEWTDRWLRDPGFAHTTQPALEAAAMWLGKLRRDCPNSRIVLLEGNHDARIARQVMTHLSSAYQLRPVDSEAMPVYSLPFLLGLDSLGIEYIEGYPDAHIWLDGVRYSHGDVVSSAPGETVKKLVRSNQESVVCGHIHRIERASRVVTQGGKSDVITGVSPGCLCHVDGDVPGWKSSHNWQQGFCVVTEGQFEVYRIVDGGVVFRGMRVK